MRVRLAVFIKRRLHIQRVLIERVFIGRVDMDRR